MDAVESGTMEIIVRDHGYSRQSGTMGTVVRDSVRWLDIVDSGQLVLSCLFGQI